MHPISVSWSSTRSALTNRCCATPASMAAFSLSGGHGFVRKRKICPSLIAAGRGVHVVLLPQRDADRSQYGGNVVDTQDAR